MLYTIGHTKSYLQYFDECDKPMKKGKTSKYEGGSVWLTKEEAQRHCPNNYSVFGVKCTINDTELHPKGKSYRCLLISSELVKFN